MLYEQAKKFLEDRDRQVLSEEVKSSRANVDDGLVVLSDEINTESEGDSVERVSTEKPGNAQFLETPRVQQQIDFRIANQEELFGKRKEVFKMKAEKLSFVDCQLCQLLYDYTSTC